jgi:D-threo-aldose 1-dehydrogenase
VTSLCLGGGPLANLPKLFDAVPDEQAYDVLRTVFRSPIHFLDTSAAYGDGEGERRTGYVIRELGGLPPGYVLQTKADRGGTTNLFSGDDCRRSVEESLERLGLERLPIVYLHDPEHSPTPFEEIMAPGGAVDVLLRYKAEGLIDAVGVAGGPLDMMARYVATDVFDAVLTHNRFTLLSRAASPLLDMAADRRMAALNAAVYGGGLLAKGASGSNRFAYREATPAMLDAVRAMEALLAKHDIPLAAAALQFSLRDPRITATIVGMERAEQVAQTVALAQHPIPDDLWPTLDAISATAGFTIN